MPPTGCELQFIDIGEALAQMGLHGSDVFAVGQNLDQLRVGEEVETREVASLGLQVVFQLLMHVVQRLSVSLKSSGMWDVGCGMWDVGCDNKKDKQKTHKKKGPL